MYGGVVGVGVCSAAVCSAVQQQVNQDASGQAPTCHPNGFTMRIAASVGASAAAVVETTVLLDGAAFRMLLMPAPLPIDRLTPVRVFWGTGDEPV